MMDGADTTATVLADAATLQARIDELRDAVTKIEADLEFDDDRFPEWRPRAISALAHKRRQLYDAERELRRATRKLPGTADIVAAKAAKNQSKAATKLMIVAGQEAAAERRRKDRLELAARMSFSLAFQRAAQTALAPDVYSALLEAAAKLVSHVEKNEVKIAQRENGADMHPGDPQ